MRSLRSAQRPRTEILVGFFGSGECHDGTDLVAGKNKLEINRSSVLGLRTQTPVAHMLMPQPVLVL